VKSISIGNSFSTGQFLIALAACAALSQSTYAGNPGDTSGKHSNNSDITSINHKTIRKTPDSVLKQKSGERNDYADICIFCHIPNMANHKISAPQWNNTIKAIPAN
jgi:hypothetical protein